MTTIAHGLTTRRLKTAPIALLALVMLLVVLLAKWHTETYLGFTTASLNLVLLGACVGFPLTALIVTGMGWAICLLSDRKPSFQQHLGLYLQTSLWMIFYHALVLSIRMQFDTRPPLWIGWVLQPAIYGVLVYRFLRRL